MIPSLNSPLYTQTAPNTIKDPDLAPCYKAHTRPDPCPKCHNHNVLNMNNHPKLKTIRSILQTEIKNYLPKLTQALSSLNNEIVHEGIRCINCKAFPIKGCRYKCTVCYDFDYCQSCEMKTQHDHPFIKIKHPDLAAQIASSESKKKARKPKNRQCEVRTRLLYRLVNDTIGYESCCPGDIFCKKWVIRNEGETEWPSGCRLVLINGDVKGEPTELPCLKPGEEFEVCVQCVCPEKEGQFFANFRAEDADGNRFGHKLTVTVCAQVMKKTQEDVEKDIETLIRIFSDKEVVKEAYLKAEVCPRKASEILFSKYIRKE